MDWQANAVADIALTDPRPPLPCPRGPLTRFLVDHLMLPPHRLPPWPAVDDDPLSGDELHLGLYVCYELHYRSFAGVHDAWEWEPSLLALRAQLEAPFELAVETLVGTCPQGGDIAAELHHVIGGGGGPSLSTYMADVGTRRELEELAIHRSAYQLKEADPHTWAIPRLAGAPKAAMVEIQADEYGNGVEAEMHASLFAQTMADLGLDPTYGAYLDLLPGTTLATVNLVSMFGLHRRRRGALVGHLAVFEMTSVTPMGRYSRALARHRLGPAARRFYDVHVEADVRHSVVAAGRMAGGLAAAEPALFADIVFGARALMAVEARFTAHLLSSWSDARSSLLERSFGGGGRGEGGRGRSGEGSAARGG
ncbi:MAG: iron-containing redox enzyme family protein, partial [Acidimicrobiales bacterium]